MGEVKFGILGTGTATYDEQGFTDILVVIQESGLFAGAPPLERRIREPVPFNDEEFGKQWVAKLNRHTDLPFYLALAKVKVDGKSLTKYTDADLIAIGIEPLEDDEEES